MNKLPTKQIYMLTIIIVGIITLSVYSTYAIFTFEGQTSDVVNIHTPNSLTISTDMYEYKQLTVPKNQIIEADIDVYNTHEYELCYSIWYKVVSSNNVSADLVKIYQKTDTNLTASGIIESMVGTRVTLLIINDNDEDIKVNIGLATVQNEGNCALNISKDKSTITNTINNYKNLGDTLIENIKTQNNQEGYLTYENIETPIEITDLEKIYISQTFTYTNEIFTLTNPEEVEVKDINNYLSNEENKYYTCISNQNCRILYQINKTNKETKLDEETNTDKDYYKITKYHELVGYLSGESGLRKINNNNISNYVYYGDNPNNFIYYNCKNELDNKSCELWRIIGLFYDSETNEYLTKIIKDSSLGTFKYNDTEINTWQSSSLNKYLNEEYKLNNYGYLEKVKQTEQQLTNLNLTLEKITTTSVDKENYISIMSLTDYINASTCKNDKLLNEYDETCLNSNWLNKNYDISEWTLTTKYTESTIDETTGEEIVPVNNTVYSVNSSINETNISDELNVRPIAYLKSRILLTTGEGTINNPYIIK